MALSNLEELAKRGRVLLEYDNHGVFTLTWSRVSNEVKHSFSKCWSEEIANFAAAGPGTALDWCTRQILEEVNNCDYSS